MNHIIMNSTTCSGCKACFSVCGKNAIYFKADDEGFQIPLVDADKCIDCGLCVKTCPSLYYSQEYDNKNKARAYALQYHDEKARINSASGALFPAFANYFINNLNGYVCGCILDENLVAKHIVSKRWQDVMRMQDSKYVQSDMGNCIHEIISLLKGGEKVLFSGTSCQVRGLKSALQTKSVDASNLLTIDFFCHGVPSPMVWKDYIQLYQNSINQEVDGFKFRNKSYGWGKGPQVRGACFLTTWFYKGKYHEKGSLLARLWPRIFFSNLCLRSYCYNCPYTKVDKPADITMGDFWGIESFRPSFDDHKGCSLAIVRNEKANLILNELVNMELLEVSIGEVIEKQGNAFAPSSPNEHRAEFWRDYQKNGITGVLPKYFDYTLKGRLKAYVKYFLFKIHAMKYNY